MGDIHSGGLRAFIDDALEIGGCILVVAHSKTFRPTPDDPMRTQLCGRLLDALAECVIARGDFIFPCSQLFVPFRCLHVPPGLFGRAVGERWAGAIECLQSCFEVGRQAVSGVGEDELTKFVEEIRVAGAVLTIAIALQCRGDLGKQRRGWRGARQPILG